MLNSRRQKGVYSHNIATKTHIQGERRIKVIKGAQTQERTNFVKKKQICREKIGEMRDKKI